MNTKITLQYENKNSGTSDKKRQNLKPEDVIARYGMPT
jgi:hypothetical protein